MVNLLPQSTIDSFNIDTVERAIVFSTLALQTAISKVPDNLELRQKVKLDIRTKNLNDLILAIDVALPLNLYNFGKYGGNFLQSIDFFDVGNATISSSDFNLTNISPTAPTPPTLSTQRGLVHFERYLFYYANILLVSLTANRNEVVTIAPKINNFDNSIVTVRVNLPINIASLIQNSTLIEAIETVATTYASGNGLNFNNNTSSSIDNNTTLNNSILLVN